MELFRQYIQMKVELHDIEERIKRLQRQINNVIGDYRKKQLLLLYKEKLDKMQAQLLNRILVIEEIVEKIETRDLKLIARFHFIDGLTWVQVAHRLNVLCKNKKRLYTDESCRKKIERFFHGRTIAQFGQWIEVEDGT